MTSPVVQRLAAWWTVPLLRWSIVIVLSCILGVVALEALGVSVFQRIGMPHEYCYVRQPALIWLHVVADALIGVAYVSISVTLGYLVHKTSKGIPFHSFFLAFGLFIVSCGFTHFMEVWVIWEPVYWLSGGVKVVTAAASVATAIALFPLVPKIFRLVESARESEARRVKIEELNAELEQFNYSVAHDLRAPLRGIAGFSQALREDCETALPREGVEYIDRMQQSVAKMDALIGDLLNYARIGRQEITLRRIEADEVARSVVSLLEAEIRRRGGRVALSPLPPVIGDPLMLQVALQNLVGNGLKFVAPDTPPQVEVSATRPNPSTVAIHVVDNGVGFPQEARNRAIRMFERFNTNSDGTGIGLSIVQRAVERMNGWITIDDAPSGRGTRFTIHLPARE